MGPKQDLLNPKLWECSQAVCALTSSPGGSGACWRWEPRPARKVFHSLIKGMYILALTELYQHPGRSQTNWEGVNVTSVSCINWWHQVLGSQALGKLESGWPWRIREIDFSFRNYFSPRFWGSLVSKVCPISSSQERPPQNQLITESAGHKFWKWQAGLEREGWCCLIGKKAFALLPSLSGWEVPWELRSGQDWDSQEPGGARVWRCCHHTSPGLEPEDGSENLNESLDFPVESSVWIMQKGRTLTPVRIKVKIGTESGTSRKSPEPVQLV